MAFTVASIGGGLTALGWYLEVSAAFYAGLPLLFAAPLIALDLWGWRPLLAWVGLTAAFASVGVGALRLANPGGTGPDSAAPRAGSPGPRSPGLATIRTGVRAIPSAARAAAVHSQRRFP